MTKKKHLFILFMLFVTLICRSQIENKNQTENIERKVISYIRYKGYLESIKSITKNHFSIIEVKENKILGFNKIGIYRLIINQSHSPVYIILKQKNKIKILDLENFVESLNSTVKFLKKNRVNNIDALFYLEKIINTHNNNKLLYKGTN